MANAALPTTQELLARALPPEQFAGCAVVAIGNLLYWKPRAELTDDDQRVFFDGDCREVLAPDDPRIVAALK